MKARDITLTEFTNTFVPFALLVSMALLAAEATQALPKYRMIYAIWASLALTIPSLCLFILPGDTQHQRNYWTLFWTFGYLAYLVHFYYAVFVHYHGSLSEVFSHQGVKIAGPNFLLTGLWGLDVVLAWTADASHRWVRIERVISHIVVIGIFFVSSVVIFKGSVNILGYLMTGSVLVCLAIRLFTKLTPSAAPELGAR